MRIRAPPMPYSEVLPKLYVGDEIAAIAPEVHEFQCILNITEEVPKSALLEDGVTFQRFPILDLDASDQAEQDKMLGFFHDACAMVKQNLAMDRLVLVHCAEGKRRSCTVVVAYLMQTLGLSVLEAVSYLSDRHPQAFDYGADLHFGPALEAWERSLRSADEAVTQEDVKVSSSR